MKTTPKKTVVASKETLEKLRSMPYSEYLRTKHWKAFRLKALKHHGKKCMMCGIKEVPYFHVHHLTYERLGCEEFKDVVVLCEECHNEVHKTGFVIKSGMMGEEKKDFIEHRDWSKRRKSGRWTAPKCHKQKKKKKPTVLPITIYKLSEEELKKYRGE